MAAPGEIAIWGDEAPSLLGWTAQASGDSQARLAVEPDGALRFDFELAGPTSWAIARRELRAALPEHYVAYLRLRSRTAPQELQLKLVGAGGRNVWWWRERPFPFSEDGELHERTLRKAGLEFAWGPASGGDPGEVGAVELAVAPGDGGRGTLFVEALRIEPRPPPQPLPRAPALRASSRVPGHEPERVLERGEDAGWLAAAGDPAPWLELDLGRRFEWGGVTLEPTGEPAPGCRLLGSLDGEAWTPLAESPAGRSGPRWLRCAGELRYARIELDAAARAGIRRLGLVPLELALAPLRHLAALARRAPRGAYPRHLLDEQAPWCVVGADGDDHKGLLGEDGALEVGAESFSIEPFVYTDRRLCTWSDAAASPSLAGGSLPIPTVEWEVAGLRLRITAWAAGRAGASALVARYELANPGERARRARLVLALRPFQVTPAWQGLGFTGGFAPLTSIERERGGLRANGAWQVVAVSRPDASGALPSAEGPLAARLAAGELPARDRADDPLGLAEGALAFDFELAPGARQAAGIAVPLHPETPRPAAGLARGDAERWLEASLRESEAYWSARLALPFALPAGAAAFEESARASLAWVLVNREGPRIQAGPRAYRRSWIRDGAFTSSALAAYGLPDEARAFLRWYAPHQLPDGRVPCAVDRSGVDPVPEHDSHGQLIWASAEVWRLTGDGAFLAELWPRLLRAADAVAALRAQRTGPERRGDASYGLLPESISHEGYSSQPVHSYWDDFFALRGLSDAADAAAALGETAHAERIAALRDAFGRDLRASLERSMERHGIDFLPGSVELGDFDPASTAAAIDPCGAGPLLPRAALERTYERYLEELAARRERPPESHGPYELRTASALLWLGRKAEALALLAGLIADQRPPAWRQWPEILWRDPRAPRFLGDLPHGWIASTFLRSVRRLLASEREDGALVLAPGIPEAWVREPPGVRVGGLPTYFGPLSYTLCADGEDRVRLALGPGLRPPPGGLVVESPCARPLRGAAADGRALGVPDPRRIALATLPAELILHY